jgi:hypothetical protein
MKWVLSLIWIGWLIGFGITFLGLTLKFWILCLGTIGLVFTWSIVCEFFDKANLIFKMFQWAEKTWEKYK